MASKRKNLFQNNISNERTRLRKRMEELARSHRGCKVARGCKCYTDRALTILEQTERALFNLELESYGEEKEPHGGYNHYAKNLTDKPLTQGELVVGIRLNEEG